jgi:hypothetical protein
MSRFTIEHSIAAFLDAVRSQGLYKVGFDDAVFNATALEAAMRSIQSGKPEAIVPVGMEAMA